MAVRRRRPRRPSPRPRLRMGGCAGTGRSAQRTAPHTPVRACLPCAAPRPGGRPAGLARMVGTRLGGNAGACTRERRAVRGVRATRAVWHSRSVTAQQRCARGGRPGCWAGRGRARGSAGRWNRIPPCEALLASNLDAPLWRLHVCFNLQGTGSGESVGLQRKENARNLVLEISLIAERAPQRAPPARAAQQGSLEAPQPRAQGPAAPDEQQNEPTTRFPTLRFATFSRGPRTAREWPPLLQAKGVPPAPCPAARPV